MIGFFGEIKYDLHFYPDQENTLPAATIPTTAPVAGKVVFPSLFPNSTELVFSICSRRLPNRSAAVFFLVVVVTSGRRPLLDQICGFTSPLPSVDACSRPPTAAWETLGCHRSILRSNPSYAVD
ncbi:hypothetical protein L2E82_44048 [Cichorium intybus]|uniref:Uncharacterized protein n=1 Tax=Cichorium intybus TaxID=13427 RepID=A0ACB8ZQN6_CICIN|nr:hypothetical protein L2E82_44048 [Cichorium intybus]